jgi:hypothetical protein
MMDLLFIAHSFGITPRVKHTAHLIVLDPVRFSALPWQALPPGARIPTEKPVTEPHREIHPVGATSAPCAFTANSS